MALLRSGSLPVGLVLVGAWLSAASCGGEESEGGAGGAGGNACGPVSIPDAGPEPTFANVRAQVFVSCGFSSCHNTANPALGDVKIRKEAEEAQAVWDDLVGAPSFRADAEVPVRVVPGDPDASYLWWRALGTDPSDSCAPVAGGPMPLGCEDGTCLTQEQLSLLRRWILAGAPRD